MTSPICTCKGECTECFEPRASRMPSHMEAVDPAFLEAIREVPVDAAKEKEEVG